MRRFGLARQPPRPRQRLHATRLLSVLLCLPCLAASSFAGTARSGAAVSDSATWSIVAGATASLDTTFYLSDDTCVGPTDCIAVGSSATAGEDSVQPLIESWDGTEWSSTIPPLISGSGGGLTAVSCADADHCLAVGNGDGGQLIESWDGITWSAVSPPATAGHLTGVSCPAPDHCVAVGWGVYQFYGITLMETWDGTTWSVAEGPAKSANNYFLNGISCTDDGNDCMAVGDYDPGVGGGIVTESWDGTDWSFATLAGPVSEGILNGVSCPDPSDCVAVGTHVVGRSTLTLVESWNGTSWSTIPSPNPTYGPKRLYSYSQLSAVSCSNTLSCSAVGDAVAKKGTQKKPASGGTLVETWDGSNLVHRPQSHDSSERWLPDRRILPGSSGLLPRLGRIGAHVRPLDIRGRHPPDHHHHLTPRGHHRCPVFGDARSRLRKPTLQMGARCRFHEIAKWTETERVDRDHFRYARQNGSFIDGHSGSG